MKFPIPKSLSKRPWDLRRKLPIPVVNEHPNPDGGDSIVDFTAINGMTALRYSKARKCGLCGELMRGAVAFIGGPMAAQHQSYLDPPMHIACARAALTLCPHIAHSKTKRAKKSKVETETPDGFVEDKPEMWVLYITNKYTLVPHRNSYVFVVGKASRQETFVYDENGDLCAL